MQARRRLVGERPAALLRAPGDQPPEAVLDLARPAEPDTRSIDLQDLHDPAGVLVLEMPLIHDDVDRPSDHRRDDLRREPANRRHLREELELVQSVLAIVRVDGPEAAAVAR